MVKVLIIFCLLFNHHTLYSQKDFEGYIDYEVRDPFRARLNKEKFGADADSSPVESARIYFSPNRIRMDSKESNRKQLTVIIYLDSGKIYSSEKSSNKFTLRKLEETSPLPPVGAEIIAGYRATPDLYDSRFIPLYQDRTIFWYADSLFFHIPEKYAGDDELIMVRNNRIMLKGWIFSKRYISVDEESMDTTRIIARKVTPTVNPPSLFNLPKDAIIDSVYNSVIELEQLPSETPIPPPPPPPHQPVPKTKKGQKELRKRDDNQ